MRDRTEHNGYTSHGESEGMHGDWLQLAAAGKGRSQSSVEQFDENMANTRLICLPRGKIEDVSEKGWWQQALAKS